MSDDILRRIDGWESAGLVDRPTADRLREAERAVGSTPRQAPAPPVRAVPVINPAAMVVEVFGYLGAFFMLGAWFLFIDRLASDGENGELVRFVGSAVAAAIAAGLGWFWRTERGSRGRASSAAFLVSSSTVAGAAFFALALVGVTDDGSWATVGVIVSGAALLAAAAYRWLRPALGTQVGALVAVTGLAMSVFGWARETFFSSSAGELPPDPDPLQVALTMGFWLAVALGLGILGLAEARSSLEGASLRSAATRVWAGLTAVLGTISAVTLTTFDGERVIPPILGAAILLVLSAVFLERSVRRQAAAFIVPAALGIFLALTDLNNTIANADGEGIQPVFLLVEGLLLLAVAGAAEWFRRRLVGRSSVTAGPEALTHPAAG